VSTGLELIPFAIAAGVGAIGRYRARRAEEEALNALNAPPFSFDTRMRDEELLIAAASVLDPDVSSVSEASGIERLVGTELSFRRLDGGAFEAQFPPTVSSEQARSLLETLDGEYTRLVQARVYEQVLAQAEQQGLSLESERVDEDSSIVLTLRVESS